MLSEPLKWGQRLTLFDFELVWEKGRWTVEKVGAQVLNSNTADEDPKITRLLGDEHKKVVAYVNQVIGTSTAGDDHGRGAVEGRADHRPDQPCPGGDGEGGAGRRRSTRRCRCSRRRRCFSRTAAIPAGQVTIRDAAGLYVFENTLEARLLTGAQIKDYLEFSARYYVQTPAGRSRRHRRS